MLYKLRHLLALTACLVLLGACGGGADSSVTTLRCSNSADCSTTGVTVGEPFVQKVNNLEVTVDRGPAGLFSLSTNILYASVTVCAPGARPGDSAAGKCVLIDHLQVDTGSVGLRILASKVAALGLLPVELAASANAAGVAGRAHECYPFVVGGLWGPTAVADVGLGEQWATALPVQLIQDDPGAAVQAPMDCFNAVNGQILSSASSLGSNGILGIGSVTLDCGVLCLDSHYANSYVQYYSCPPGASSALACYPAAVGANQQVFNPVAKLGKDLSNNGLADNNGVVLVLPAVPGTGAAKVIGELFFGINTRNNDQLPLNARQIHLGVDWQNSLSPHGFDSYLSVTTQFNGQTIYNSYLDTGTNGLFFTDSSITPCNAAVTGQATWYCPANPLTKKALMSDGDRPGQNPVEISFVVGDAGTIAAFDTAIAGLAGAPASSLGTTSSFSWGLPFFYGKRVSLSIWDPASKDAQYSTGPWYSF